MRLHILAMLIAAALPACTIIEVQGDRPSTSYHFGVLKISPAPGAGSVAYRSRGVGIVPGLSGLTVGYKSEDAVFVTDPDDCRIILFDRPHQAMAANAASQLNTLCQTGG